MIAYRYQPTDVDLLWAKRMVSLLVDGGVLAYPATSLIYKLDKTRHKLILTNPQQLNDPHSAELHNRTIVVFEAIGYEVTLPFAA